MCDLYKNLTDNEIEEVSKYALQEILKVLNSGSEKYYPESCYLDNRVYWKLQDILIEYDIKLLPTLFTHNNYYTIVNTTKETEFSKLMRELCQETVHGKYM